MTRKDLIRMVFIMTFVAGLCGAALAMVKIGTRDQIEYQQIRFIKAPVLDMILPPGYDNDPILDRRAVSLDAPGNNGELTVFLAKKGEKVIAVAFESFAQGYGGPMGVMLAVDPAANTLLAAAVTTHSETPGLGTRVMDVPSFRRQFENKALDQDFRLRSQGGPIQGITGATISATAMAGAVSGGVDLFPAIRDRLGLE